MRKAVLLCATMAVFLGTTPALAGTAGAIGGHAPGQHACAAALNGYLSYRRSAAGQEDSATMERLESVIGGACRGYKLRIEQRDGQAVAVVERAS